MIFVDGQNTYGIQKNPKLSFIFFWNANFILKLLKLKK